MRLTAKQIEEAKAVLREKCAGLDEGDVVGRATALAEVLHSDPAARARVRRGIAAAIFVMSSDQLEASSKRETERMLVQAIDGGQPGNFAAALPLLEEAGLLWCERGAWAVAAEIGDRLASEGSGILTPLGVRL